MPYEPIVKAGFARGFVSAQSPLALQPGYYARISNFRLDDGIFRSRGGSQQIYTAGAAGFPASGVVYGAFTGSLDGVVWHFMALKVSSAIQIWAAQDSVGTWTEITSPASYGAAYGTLRMSVPTQPVRFQIVHDQGFNGSTPHDLLVIQNGIDSPRVWGPAGPLGLPSGFTAPFMSITYQPPQPAISTAPTGIALPSTNPFLPWTTTAVATWPKSLPMATSSHAATGATPFVFTGIGGSPPPTFTAPSGISVGSTIKLTFTTTVDLSKSSLVALILNCPDPNIWSKISIQIGDGTNLVPLWNPQGGSSASVGDFSDIPGPWLDSSNTFPLAVQQGLFPVPAWSSGSPGTVNAATINTLVFTWVGPYVSGQATAVGVFNNGAYNGATSTYTSFLGANMTGSGFGYTSIPAVTFQVSSKPGATATGVAVMGDGVTIPKDAVAGVQITYGGFGYDTGSLDDSYITIDAPSSAYFIHVVALASSEGVLGGTSWAIAYGSSGSRAIGPRRIISNNVGDFLSNINAYSIYGGLRLQVQGQAYYGYQITYMLPAQTVLNEGVDKVLFFSKQPGNTDFYFSDFRTMANWSGSGTTWNNSSTGISTYSPALTQDLTFNAPDESIVVIPTGLAMAAANGRFFVGVQSAVWYSEFNIPFRFRQLIRSFGGQFDGSSGGSYAKTGEIIQAIVPIGAVPTQLNVLGTPISTANNVYVLTDHNCYITSGFDALSLNKTVDLLKYGTLSPMSVGIGQTFWYFLASDGQVKRIEGWSVQDISCEIVDNLTFNIPSARLPWVWGCCANLRYFMCCSQSSGGSTTTNANAMVYSERRSAWESFDAFPVSFTGEMLIADFPSSTTRLLAWSSLSSVPGVFTYDDQSQSQDAGAHAISISLTTKEWAPGNGTSVFIGACGVMADVYAAGTLVTTRVLTSGYGDSTNAVGSISLAAPSLWPGATRVNALDTSGKGTEDVSVQLVISGTVVAQWRLYEAYVEIAERQNRATRSA